MAFSDQNKSLLGAFPKERPPLPQKIKDIYEKHYKSNREGNTTAASLAQRMEEWLHRQVANDLSPYSNENGSTSQNPLPMKTLEIGAGTLNQLPYEPQCEQYDIIEPFQSLFADSPFKGLIHNVYGDISEVPQTNRYHRITSVAALEHICNLPEVVAISGTLLSEKGCFRASIPSEGRLLWYLGWRLTTGLEFQLKYGLDYGKLMAHEHVNTAQEIEDILRYFFQDVQRKLFGLSPSISLYQFFECQTPLLDRCEAYVRTLKK